MRPRSAAEIGSARKLSVPPPDAGTAPVGRTLLLPWFLIQRFQLRLDLCNLLLQLLELLLERFSIVALRTAGCLHREGTGLIGDDDDGVFAGRIDFLDRYFGGLGGKDHNRYLLIPELITCLRVFSDSLPHRIDDADPDQAALPDHRGGD